MYDHDRLAELAGIRRNLVNEEDISPATAIETDSSRRRRIGDEIIQHLGGESFMQGVAARRFERLARGVVFDIPGKTINRIAVVQADDGTFSIIGYLVVNTNVQKKVAKTNIQAGDLHDAFLGMVQRTA